MFKTIQRLTLAAALLASVAANAAPVSFNVNLVSLTPGSGYGTDTHEASGNLLDVRFNAATAPHSFILNNPGDFYVFNVGTVAFLEPNSNGGINGTEASGDLSVTALFSFTNPFGGTEILQAFGLAKTGGLSDAAVDFQLTWLATTVAFSGGSFDLALMPMAFDNTTQTRTLLAMISLNSVSSNIPEPAGVALFGLALAGLGMVRRMRA